MNGRNIAEHTREILKTSQSIFLVVFDSYISGLRLELHQTEAVSHVFRMVMCLLIPFVTADSKIAILVN